jgi:hypothetical protein
MKPILQSALFFRNCQQHVPSIHQLLDFYQKAPGTTVFTEGHTEGSLGLGVTFIKDFLLELYISSGLF